MNALDPLCTIKPPVEVRCREELEVLRKIDEEQGNKRPDNWQMSPRAVRTFILGSEKPVEYQGNKYQIRKKSSEVSSRWRETVG